MKRTVDLPESLAGMAKVILKPRRAMPFFHQHPWVFAGAIEHIAGDPAPGAEVILCSDRGEFIARGLFNPDSNIRVRLYSWEMDQPLDRSFWSTRIDEALSWRNSCAELQEAIGGVRLICSEADGLSGMTVDRYADWLLVQFTSRALAMQQGPLIELLQEKLQPAGIWLRTEKGIREAEALELQDGPISGGMPPRPLFIEEHGLKYGIDIVEGQKTGFYLDQRENRKRAAEVFPSGRVLDVCCYSGGFSLNLARREEIREVVAVDVSESALTLARANAELNGLAPKIDFRKGDAFRTVEQLQGAGERFQGIVLDPPKMARHKKSLPDALKGYHRLNRAALQMLTPGGILMTCSCSGHVDRDLFESVVADAAIEAGRRVQILESRGPALDHPVSLHCLESRYLKCLICRVV